MKNYYFDAIYQKGLTGLLQLLSIFASYVEKYIPLVARTFVRRVEKLSAKNV